MKKRIYSLLTIALLIAMGSCKKDYLDINTNPNTPTSSTPDLVLSNALNVTAGGNSLNRNEIGSFWAGYWSPSGSVSGFIPEKTYDITSNFRTGIWNTTYDNLKDYDYVEQSAAALKYQSFVGVAKVMKAFNYQILVDTYGNVPYTEALQGTKGIRPKYDDAQAIYEDLISQLDGAITDLKVPTSADNPKPGASDIFFKGDLSKWTRFANTLKLRILIRQAYVPGREDYIKGEIAKIIAQGSGFLGANENVTSNPGYLQTDGKQNQFWDNYGFTAAGSQAGNHDFFTISDFSVKLLGKLGDNARLEQIAAPSSAGVYKGVPFGEGSDAYVYSKVSGFGPAVLKAYNQPMVVMTASESFFLQAEAAQRGWLSGDAKALFESGITESFKMLEVEDAETAASDYYTSGIANADWEASADKIEAIITQKWVGMHSFTGFEAWAEFRRTGFPAVPFSTKASVSKHPARLLYPIQEISTNNDNVVAQGNINTFDSKIFWDKN